MIELQNVKKEMGEKLLFENVNLTIYDGERVGIIGSNGAGKTTLAKIIVGETEPDGGRVNMGGETVGYLKQASEYSTQDFLDLAQDAGFIGKFMELKSKLNIRDDIDFSKERLALLSGGERTKLMLAHILAGNPTTLLLDEPTNHVDYDSITWLVEVLNEYHGTVIIISHDRKFLNDIATKIVEIENSTVTEYYGDYDAYKEQKNLQLSGLKSQYQAQIKTKKKIESQIADLTKWSNKGENESRRQGGMPSDSRLTGAQTRAQAGAAKLAKQAKNKASRLSQEIEDFIDRPYEERDVHYKINANTPTAKVLVRVTDLNKKFGDTVLFDNVNFEITARDKIALTGANGCGKTTLINMLFGTENPTHGDIWKTPSLKPIVLSQDVFDLDGEKTILQLSQELPIDQRTLFLTNLINMNMRRNSFDRKIKTMSLGERMRIKMAQVILSDANLIILDEPTNHLDIKNKEELERVLGGYNGALVVISHDKAFLENTTNIEFKIENQTIKIYT